MNVLICGSRTWPYSIPVETVVAGLANPGMGRVRLTTGGAAGADKIAEDWANAYNLPLTVVRADWEKHGPTAGPIRNQRMLDEHDPHVVWAFRLPGRSPGTDNMIAKAKAAGVEVYVVTPA